MFKIGDKVKRTDGSFFEAKIGETYTVKKQEGYNLFLNEIGGNYSASAFRLVEESKKYIVIEEEETTIHHTLESAIVYAKRGDNPEIYELGRKLEKKTVVTWE